MFELLSDRLSQVFKRLSGRGRLGEKDIDEALRQVRLALLEADVNLKVVKLFTSRVRERCLKAEVLESLTPYQQVIKIVYEELLSILGEGGRLTPSPHPPSVLMLVGLQGSGKTTTAAKLSLYLKKGGQRSLLVAADPYRPAAIEQLAILGKQLDIPFYGEDAPPLTICQKSIKKAKEIGASWIILDTAGRLHIDKELMEELKEMKSYLNPAETLLVIDAMTGQDGVRIAEEFHLNLGLSGFIITKMDGDARGGVALSIREVTGVPIKFIGIGEKPDALEPFHPQRIASRILGMGDVLTLIEKAEEAIDVKKAKEMEKKIKAGQFDLEDFLWQIKELRKIGPLPQILEMIPGFSSFARQISPQNEKRLKKMEAIILSMTPEERRNPQIIDGSRRKRIARGSGTTIQEVNQLLNQYYQLQKIMKKVGKKEFLSLLKSGFTGFSL